MSSYSKVGKVYEDAVASGLIPGYSLLAGDIDDCSIIYAKSGGRASLRKGDERPFTDSTVCFAASMAKLMTSVAVLQAVEDGILDLDTDVKPLFPRIGEHGIIGGDDNITLTPLPASSKITLRQLLSHTSGHESDQLNPLLIKWRASRNEGPWSGPTVEQKAGVPLVFAPGEGFAYGGGHDWAGKAIEVATNTTLEQFMQQRIWQPLGIGGDASFFPTTTSVEHRIAGIATLGEDGKPPAVEDTSYDPIFGSTECLGGGGLFISAKAYHTFLSAVARRDPRLFKDPSSWNELFKPQLNEMCEQKFNEYILQFEKQGFLLGLGFPPEVRKTWSFAGMIIKEGVEGRCGPGTIYWAGVLNTLWFIDFENGICGTAMCQFIPPLFPSVMALHEQFQRGVLAGSKATGIED